MKQIFRKTLPVYGVRLVLSAVSPFQTLLDRPGYTHEFCIRQSMKILGADGLAFHKNVCSNFLRELIAGVYWADTGWKNICHYYDPVRRLGLWNMPSAIEVFQGYYRQAMACVRQGDDRRGMFYLGAASHLLQDLCVPHHATGQLFNGHKQFEVWAGANCEQFQTENTGKYTDRFGVSRLAMQNAAVAAELLSQVRLENETDQYMTATRILLPLAQQSTAGLFEHFITACAESLRARIRAA